MLIGFGGNRGRVGWPAVTQPWPVVRVRGGAGVPVAARIGTSAAEFPGLTSERRFDKIVNSFSWL
jgi:hypothetical protein